MCVCVCVCERERERERERLYVCQCVHTVCVGEGGCRCVRVWVLTCVRAFVRECVWGAGGGRGGTAVYTRLSFKLLFFIPLEL